MDSLPIPLYHGTSTLFLSGIASCGLGGKNPLAEWKVLDFARAILPLVDEHFSRDKDWMQKAQSFGFMAQQMSASMNFQHGDAYLSPSRSTAVRYATNKRFGSELLTYALEFLQQLINRKVPGVVDKLFQRYPQIFRFLDISCAPLLIEVRRIATVDLLDEHGRDPEHNIGCVQKALRENPEMTELLLSQTNFRIRAAAPIADLTFWLINVDRWHPITPEYSLHLSVVPGAFNNGIQPPFERLGFH